MCLSPPFAGPMVLVSCMAARRSPLFEAPSVPAVQHPFRHRGRGYARRHRRRLPAGALPNGCADTRRAQQRPLAGWPCECGLHSRHFPALVRPWKFLCLQKFPHAYSMPGRNIQCASKGWTPLTTFKIIGTCTLKAVPRLVSLCSHFQKTVVWNASRFQGRQFQLVHVLPSAEDLSTTQRLSAMNPNNHVIKAPKIPL